MAGAGARGVGLSLVKRLVERRGGSIRLADADGCGAVFEVRLPVVLRTTEPLAPSTETRAGT
jgi:two-component system CitB family sensor kinase